MRFKEFLNEAVITKWAISKLDSDNVINELDTHCYGWRTHIADGVVLQRGFRDKLEYEASVIDSLESKRTSQDTNNIYQLMMNSSDDLKEFPSRSNSIICLSGSSSYYGERYIVFPFKNTDIAFVPTSDIFDIELTIPGIVLTLRGMSHVSNKIENFLKIFKIKDENHQYTDADLINDALSDFNIDQLVTGAFLGNYSTFSKSHPDAFELANSIWIDGTVNSYNKQKFLKLTEIIKDNLPIQFNKFKQLMEKNPKKRFSALASASFTKKHLEIQMVKGDKYPSRCECWFSGKAIVISMSKFVDIVKQLISNGQEVGQELIQQTDSSRI